MVRIEIYPRNGHSDEWSFRFVGGNGQPFGHNYNSVANARKSIDSLIYQLQNDPVEIVVLDEDEVNDTILGVPI